MPNPRTGFYKLLLQSLLQAGESIRSRAKDLRPLKDQIREIQPGVFQDVNPAFKSRKEMKKVYGDVPGVLVDYKADEPQRALDLFIQRDHSPYSPGVPDYGGTLTHELMHANQSKGITNYKSGYLAPEGSMEWGNAEREADMLQELVSARLKRTSLKDDAYQRGAEDPETRKFLFDEYRYLNKLLVPR